MVHEKEEHLIGAHEKRMDGLETWCSKLEGMVIKKASTTHLWTGLTLAVIIIGGLLAIIWQNIQANQKMLRKVQIYQVQFMKEMGFDPKDPYGQ